MPALAVLLFAPSARAWTNAAVHHVQARVVLSGDASAHVTLTADVRVHGGWLEGLEMAGLDPDLVLDEEQPPWAVDESGQRYHPRAEVRDGGRVLLSFPHSPHRGRVSVQIAYRTSLAHRATEPVEGEPRVRVRWTLPAWRSGLDGVQIDVVAPPGSRMGPGDDGKGGPSMTTEVVDEPEGIRLSWRRAHLPRTLSWTVAVDVPAEAMVPELRGSPVVTPPPAPVSPRAATPVDPAPYWLVLAVALALACLVKIVSVAGLARRSRARARPLVPLPGALRAPIALGFAAMASWAGPEQPFAGLAALAGGTLLATYRRADPGAGSQLGAWRPVDTRWLRAARRSRWLSFLSPGALLDATTPLGAITLVSWSVLPFVVAAPLSNVVRASVACLALPLFLTGTRIAFPTGPADALAILLRLARRLPSLPEDMGLRPVVHVDVRGAVQDARVRTVLTRRPRGLLRLDLVVIEAARGGRFVRRLAVLVLTRDGSAAEKALTEAMADVDAESSPGGRRVVRVLPFDRDPGPILARLRAALADCPEAPVASRGTATPQQTVRDLPAPHAVGF